MNFKGFVLQFDSKTVQGRFQQVLTLSGMQIASRCFQIVDCILIIGEDIPAVFRSNINLQRIIVPVQVRRGNLNPVAVYLPECSLVAEPAPIIL